MELVLVSGPAAGGAGRETAGEVFPGSGPVIFELRRQGLEEAKILEGLPRHRYYQNTVYEIIDPETLEELALQWGVPGSPDRFILRGRDIPRFVSAHFRLIYQFADPPLKRLLAEDRVFLAGEEMSLILLARQEQGRGRGMARAAPVIKYRNRYYHAGELSRLMEGDYVLLDDKWAGREELEKTGIFPLGRYAGGAVIENIKLTPLELFRRGGQGLRGFFADLEADTEIWISRGDREQIFHSHLEFLRSWGFSGGVLAPGHRDQARFLADWLSGLQEKLKTGRPGEDAGPGARALILMEKRYYELYLGPLLPDPQSLLPPVRICFYEDLPASPAGSGAAPLAEGGAFWDILVLVEGEEILLDEKTGGINQEAFSNISALETGLRIGIFSDLWGIKNSQGAGKVRAFFGIPGEYGEIGDYLIRDIKTALPFPAPPFPPPGILRPPRPFGGDSLFRYTPEAKFRDLPAHRLFSELALFNSGGSEAPYTPLGSLKGETGFDSLDERERAFFLYWRECFRGEKAPQGDTLKTDEAYIRLYARELCLFTGPDRKPMAHFRELLRLWRIFRDLFPALDSFLPQWLFDFALVYDIGEEALPLLFPFAQNCGIPLLTDLYLHRRYIGENNLISLEDIRPFIPDFARAGNLFSPPGPDFAGPGPDPRLLRDYEQSLNAIDRQLRECFRTRLFSFFYPPQSFTKTFTAFEDMSGAGYSSYTAEWVHFLGHPPLARFFTSLFHYVEYRFNIKTGREKKHRPPPLDQAWKQMVDSFLGFEDSLPEPRRQPGPPPSAGDRETAPSAGAKPRPAAPVQLSFEFLDRLRTESHEVREILGAVEDRGSKGEETEWKAIAWNGEVRSRGQSQDGFWEGTGALEREALHIILEGGPVRSRLEDLARENGAMADLIIDGINGRFLESRGDLLVETGDGSVSIQPEYREEVKRLLETP
jgi:hypothetical protein